MSDPQRVEMDGSQLEGGGQIIRNSVALSALTNTPVHIFNIRKKRNNPGLAAQHLGSVRLAADVSQGQLQGAKKGSMSLVLEPSGLRGGEFSQDTRTAGSCLLMLQAVLPCAVLGPRISLSLKGGTNAAMAPQVDHTKHVLVPLLASLFGVGATVEVVRRGYYPKGGGHIRVQVEPVRRLEAISCVERGHVTKVVAVLNVGGASVGKALDAEVRPVVEQKLKGLGVPLEWRVEEDRASPGSGAGLLLMAHTTTHCIIGGDSLLDSKKCPTAGGMGEQAADALLRNLEAQGCVDEFVQDQLVVFMGVAHGTSRLLIGREVTMHTRTALMVVSKLTAGKARFELVADDAGLVTVVCEGAGLVNRHLE